MKLKRAYDGHEPKGPLQWWRDDRKSVQWWTFWIAALVLVLTICVWVHTICHKHTSGHEVLVGNGTGQSIELQGWE
jgi:hypothetical protein